jgi:LEA14-like dessication related protein
MGTDQCRLEIILNFLPRFKCLALLFMIFSIGACSKIGAPEFKSIDDLRVDSDDTIISIIGQGRFYNPNKYRMLLKSADISVSINDQSFTHIKNDFNLVILPEQEFLVPISMDLNQEQVRTFLKKNAFQLLLGSGVHIKYKGNIRVRARGIGIRVPVNDEKSVNLRDFL